MLGRQVRCVGRHPRLPSRNCSVVARRRAAICKAVMETATATVEGELGWGTGGQDAPTDGLDSLHPARSPDWRCICRFRRYRTQLSPANGSSVSALCPRSAVAPRRRAERLRSAPTADALDAPRAADFKQRFKMGKIIGIGFFGRVYIGSEIATGREVGRLGRGDGGQPTAARRALPS
jgi:hypothetical protein